MQVVEEMPNVVFTGKRTGRIVGRMTIVDAIIQDINHLSIDEAEELYNNSMKEYENYSRQIRH